LATTVYSVEEVTLQNGSTVKLKPLSIKELRKFMLVLQGSKRFNYRGRNSQRIN